MAPPGSPDAPSDLNVIEQGGGAHVTWKDNSQNEDDFQVWRKEGGGEFAKVFTAIFDITQFHDATVAPGVTYTYKVRSENVNGASLFSNEATFVPSTSGAGGGNGATGGTGEAGGAATAGGGSAAGGNGTAGGTASAGGMASAGGSGAAGGGGGGGAVSFRRDIVVILGRSCGSGDLNCHAPITYYANSTQNCRGWLSLADSPLGAMYCGPSGCAATGCTDRTLYQRLVQLEPWMCTGGKKYVVPGDPSQSLLYKVLSSGDPSMSGACRDGNNQPLQRMPLDNATMMPAAPLPAADVELIRKWIAAGAPNN